MSGFISIERELWDHPLFKSDPMTEREAWMWMIAQASWAGTQHRVGTLLVDVPRGSFMVTLRELQSAFMWASDKRVRNFLRKLEDNQMVETSSIGSRNARKTHVTICKYDDYQSRGRSKDAPIVAENSLDKRCPNSSQTGRTQEPEKQKKKEGLDAAKTHRGRTGDAVKEQGNKGTIDKDTGVSLLAPSSEPRPPPTKSKRRTGIHEDWEPSEKNLAHARSKNLTEEEIQHEADRFRDYHLSRGTVFKDWDAGWRTWIANSIKFRDRRMVGGAQTGGSGPGGGIAGAVARRRLGGQA